MDHQNWKKQVSTSKHKSHNANLHKKGLLNKNVNTMKKTQNKGNVGGSKMHKLIESETLEIPKVSLELKQTLVKARIDKGLKQKELAQLCGVKVGIIGGYESGKTVPQNKMIARMEKILGVKLPRPKKVKL